MRDDPAKIGSDEIRRLCGDIPAWKITAIIGTGATVADVEAAAVLVAGEDDVLGKARRPTDEPVAGIYDILMAGDEEDKTDDTVDAR